MRKLLLVLVLFSTISISLSQQSTKPVLDIDGNLLVYGIEYFILPREDGGGLTLAATRNDSCPLDVVQDDREFNFGLPLIFMPMDSNTHVVRESTDLNIIFSGSKICKQSNVWMLEGYTRELIIAGNGTMGNAGLVTITSWFKIKKHEDGYKLVYCPEVCDHCATACGNIGVIIAQNGRRLMALSRVPFKVTFKKA